MRKYILSILLFSLSTARADLLDRVKLEDSIKTRVEETLHIADPNARAIVKFNFKVFRDELPGTQIPTTLELAPAKIETADISKIEVTAYTELDQFPKEIQDSLYGVIPFEKAKISLEVKKYPIPIKQFARLDSSDLSKIAEQSVKTISQVIIFSLLAMFFVMAGLLVFMNSRRMRSFKDQIQSLTNAVSEGGSRGPMPSMTAAQQKQSMHETSNNASEVSQTLHRLPVTSLAELLADCYWTEQDAYAHWIWKNLLTTQQTELYQIFDKMQQYALSFVNVSPTQMVFHEHPYYLNPNHLMQISQADLTAQMKENLGRWHLISPLRQEFLPLDLSTKLNAVQNPTTDLNWKPTHKSPARKLKTNIRWGQITLADEKAIFENPNLIPDAFKGDIPSLVWLAHKQTEQISQVLNQFDARALAEAWIGPQEVLAKLEQSLPEKKLKLLQTYRDRTGASRASPFYQALVQEGLKNEAA